MSEMQNVTGDDADDLWVLRPSRQQPSPSALPPASCDPHSAVNLADSAAITASEESASTRLPSGLIEFQDETLRQYRGRLARRAIAALRRAASNTQEVTHERT